MTPGPNEEYFEGTLVELDSGTLAAATGWTLNYVAVERIGSLVAVHIEATPAVDAAATVATIPGDYAPSATITDTTGNFTLTSGGVLAYSASTHVPSKKVCELVFKAALQSP